MAVDDSICTYCMGSGEGRYEGTTCYMCLGTGISDERERRAEERAEAAERKYDEMRDEEMLEAFEKAKP